MAGATVGPLPNRDGGVNNASPPPKAMAIVKIQPALLIVDRRDIQTSSRIRELVSKGTTTVMLRANSVYYNCEPLIYLEIPL